MKTISVKNINGTVFLLKEDDSVDTSETKRFAAYVKYSRSQEVPLPQSATLVSKEEAEKVIDNFFNK